MSALSPVSRSSRAFSIVELLVVIAVIGVVAAIAIPNIVNIVYQAKASVAQRNAQNIASTANDALAAGYPGTAWPTLESVVYTLTVPGITVDATHGGTNPMVFKVPGLSVADAIRAKNFMIYSGSTSIGAKTIPTVPMDQVETQIASLSPGQGVMDAH